MNLILYLLFFCMGMVCGSFFTLAVYRIPLHQDITHTRSYCPNCNHKLSFWDMIPIFSYLFLGGKCRYCKTPIRIRYLLLEVLSGIVFVLFAISIKLNIYNISMQIIPYTVMGLLYISTLFIIAGIDKERIKVEKPLLLFGFICVAVYVIYLCIMRNVNMYRYVIYFLIACILLLMDTMYLRKKTKSNYTIDILLLSILMVLFTFEEVYFYTVIVTIVAVSIQLIIKKLTMKKNKCVKVENKEVTKIPIAFYMCIANILTMLVTNMYFLG